jgi:hypothetical protein
MEDLVPDVDTRALWGLVLFFGAVAFACWLLLPRAPRVIVVHEGGRPRRHHREEPDGSEPA